MYKIFLKNIACLAILGVVLPTISFASEKDTYNINKDYSINYIQNKRQASADEIINFAKQ